MEPIPYAREALSWCFLVHNLFNNYLSMNHTATDIKKLLDSHKIEATPLRIGVLEILVNKPDAEFTYAEILAQIKNEKKSASLAAITGILGLFKVRNLIKEVPVLEHIKPGRKRGRPERKFVYAKSH